MTIWDNKTFSVFVYRWQKDETIRVSRYLIHFAYSYQERIEKKYWFFVQFNAISRLVRPMRAGYYTMIHYYINSEYVYNIMVPTKFPINTNREGNPAFSGFLIISCIF